MSNAAYSQSLRRFVFVTLTVCCLVLGNYKWQSRKSCSFITTQLPPVPRHSAEQTPSRIYTVINSSFTRTQNGVSTYHCSFTTSVQHIIVRSVYFDDSQRDGHQNASVFMVEARQGLVDQNFVFGCQIGKYFGKDTKIRPLDQMSWVHCVYPHINHDLFMVDCFDLPVKNGSRAFLVFKNRTSKSVESERPLVFPAPRISYGNDIKILMCVATPRYANYKNRLTVYGMLYHWLKYQRVVGVDHVHIIAHPSFLEVGSLQNDVVRKAILDQFLSIEFWEPWLNETDNYHGHSQMLYSISSLWQCI